MRAAAAQDNKLQPALAALHAGRTAEAERLLRKLLRMRPDDAEPLAVGRGRANKVIGGPVGVIVFRQIGRWCDPAERGA